MNQKGQYALIEKKLEEQERLIGQSSKNIKELKDKN